MGVWWRLVAVSVYTSLTTQEEEHLLTRFSAICASPLPRGLLTPFLHVLTEPFIFLLLNFQDLRLFRTADLCQTCVLQVFFPMRGSTSRCPRCVFRRAEF